MSITSVKKRGGGDREAQELGSLGKDEDIACLSAQLAAPKRSQPLAAQGAIAS